MYNQYRKILAILKLCGVSVLFVFSVSACVNTGAVADALSAAITNNDDPQTIKEGVPSYLILLDTLINRSPDNASLRMASARLQGAYVKLLGSEPVREQRFAQKAYDHAKIAFCQKLKSVCQSLTAPQAEFEQALLNISKKKDLPWLLGFAISWAGLIQANSSDWSMIADLPKVEAMVARVLIIDETFEAGTPHLYMGVLKTLRPAVLGGQPEKGRIHFERAIELSASGNLMAKVLYAEKYARLVFDKALHDRLLNEVIQADPYIDGLTLSNVLAQDEAKALLASGADYF